MCGWAGSWFRIQWSTSVVSWLLWEPREQLGVGRQPDKVLLSPNPAAAHGQSHEEMVFGPWPPLLPLTPLGEPGNSAGLAGSFLLHGWPCLLQLPATLLPQPLQLLSGSRRNLAVPEGPAAVLKGHCLSQPSLSPRQGLQGQVPWPSTTGSSKAGYFLRTPCTFGFAVWRHVLVHVRGWIVGE